MASEKRAKWDQPVQKLKRKRTEESLKRKRTEESLRRKTEKARLEVAYYAAKSERKQAKRKAGFFYQPSGKKKKGKKLSKKIGMRLI